MGERWTTIRDALLARGDGDHIALLHRELYRLGGVLDPQLAAFDSDSSPFPNLHDAATVSLLQAAELTHHRKLIAVTLKSAHVVSSQARMPDGMLAVAELAGEAERLFRHLATAVQPGLDRKATLTQSLVALRQAELLPLSRREEEAWTADEDWVRGERARQRKDSGRKGIPDSKAIPRLWERRVARRLLDTEFAEQCPRYLAVLELQRLRNALSHKHSSELRQLGFAHQTWGRVVGLATMTCMRVFAAGVLQPSPTPQRGATTILRPPDRTEALIAVASVMEPEPLPAIARLIEPEDDEDFGESAPPRSRVLRRLLLVTTAATLAVVAGTVGANLLSPKTVATAPTEDPVSVASPAPPALLAPPVALRLAPPAVPSRSALPQTERCKAARRVPPGTLPHLSLSVGGRTPQVLPAEQVAARVKTGDGMEPIMWLASDDDLERERLLAALETEICTVHAVLSAKDALATVAEPEISLPRGAFVVALQTSEHATDLDDLRRLSGDETRVLVAGGEPPLGMAGVTVLRAAPLDCDQAESALYGAMGTKPGSEQTRFNRWRLLPGRGDACTPGALLDHIAGVQVVAANLARHDQPPASLDGSWTRWVATSSLAPTRRSKGRVGGLPKAPDGEMDLHTTALKLDSAAKVGGPNPRRRKACERWSAELFRGNAPATPGLVTHLLGFESGQRCAAWLLAGLDAQGASPRQIVTALDRGLGTHAERAVTLKRLSGDRGRVRLKRDVSRRLGKLR